MDGKLPCPLYEFKESDETLSSSPILLSLIISVGCLGDLQELN